MTNDINTLNGALKEAGETLAANLTTQGVPSTWDEGLTTLIGKVLDITPTPPTPTPASISLTGTKSILSYADSESSVLTATVLDDNDDPVEGVSVDLYKANVLWDTLTTDSSGEVSKTYTSAGIGDVGFTAECGSLLTKTYALEDCKYANDMTSADATHWTIPSSANASYSSNGMKIQGSSWSDCYLEIPIVKPCSIEYDVTQHSGSRENPPLSNYFYDSSKTRLFHIYYSNTYTSYVCDTYSSENNRSSSMSMQDSTYRIEISSDTMKLFINDVEIVSKSYNMASPLLFGVTTSSNRSTTYKNLKIKPL